MGYNYVPRLTDYGMRTSPFYSRVPAPWGPRIASLNSFIGNPKHKGNCTSYCIGRWLEICNGDTSKMGGLLSDSNGTWDGGAWYTRSPSLQVGKTNPQPGDIACWSRGKDSYAGHVAVVEEVHPDYCVMSQSEYNGEYFRKSDNYKVNDYRSTYYINNHYYFRGFIRMSDIPAPPAIADFDMPTDWIVKPNLYDMTDVDKENNAVMAAVQLYSYGWTIEAIAGAIGNFEAESNIDPQSIGSGGGGLVGWTPLDIYTIWSNYYGYTWYDGEKQIEFISMNSYVDYHDPYNPDGTPKLKPQWQSRSSLGINISFDEYTQLHDDPGDMARYWMLCYERPLDQSAAAQAYRAEKGAKWYDFLMGINLTDPKHPYIEHMPVWMMAGKPKPKLIY